MGLSSSTVIQSPVQLETWPGRESRPITRIFATVPGIDIRTAFWWNTCSQGTSGFAFGGELAGRNEL
jgi:hypothetical protein